MDFVLTMDLKCHPKFIKFSSEITYINLLTDTYQLSMFQCPQINSVFGINKIKDNYFLFHTSNLIFVFLPAESAGISEDVQLQYVVTYNADDI